MLARGAQTEADMCTQEQQRLLVETQRTLNETKELNRTLQDTASRCKQAESDCQRLRDDKGRLTEQINARLDIHLTVRCGWQLTQSSAAITSSPDVLWSAGDQ